MEAIFNRHGYWVGWIHDGVVHGVEGGCRAFVRQASVYSYDGGYLGRFVQGFFRDTQGDAVAFVKGSKGGPFKPLPEMTAKPPVVGAPPPVPPVLSTPQAQGAPSMKWAQISWDAFLTQETVEPRQRSRTR